MNLPDLHNTRIRKLTSLLLLIFTFSIFSLKCGRLVCINGFLYSNWQAKLLHMLFSIFYELQKILISRIFVAASVMFQVADNVNLWHFCIKRIAYTRTTSSSRNFHLRHLLVIFVFKFPLWFKFHQLVSKCSDVCRKEGVTAPWANLRKRDPCEPRF